MPPTLIGYGVPDYKHFGIGAPVLVLSGFRADCPIVMDSAYAGRLAEPFRPGQALMMRNGPLADNLDLRGATQVVHWMTEHRFVREAPTAFHLAFDRPDTLRVASVMLDIDGVVESIERSDNRLRWPQHLAIAKRIEALFNQAYAMHGQTVESLLYR